MDANERALAAQREMAVEVGQEWGPLKGDCRERRRRNGRKMKISGAGLKRVYPDAIRKHAKEARE